MNGRQPFLATRCYVLLVERIIVHGTLDAFGLVASHATRDTTLASDDVTPPPTTSHPPEATKKTHHQ